MAEGNETEVRTQGYEALFHPEIDKKYMCPVCLGAMRDAMQTSCGHRFCRSCVLRLVKYVLFYSPFCDRGFAKNTGADQPAHLRSLISNFVIRFLLSILSRLATREI